MRKLLFMILAICTFASCDKDNGDGDKDITITSGDKTQIVYADDTEGKGGVTFTTTGAWTSSIVESSSTRATAPEWISIDPASGTTAGSYTINITLGNNYTGEKRTATITINCGGDKITITITQEGTTLTGDAPEPVRLIKSITESAVFNSDYYNSENPYRPYKYAFKYDDKDRLKEYNILEYNNAVYTSYIFSYDIQREVKFTDGNNIWIAELNDANQVTKLDSDDYYTKASFAYNANGYLTTIDIATVKFGYIWASDNISQVTQTGYMSTPEDFNFTFSNQLNDKATIDLNAFFFCIFGESGYRFEHIDSRNETNLLTMTGLTGKRSKNFIISTDDNSLESSTEDFSRPYALSTIPEVGFEKHYYSHQFYGQGTYTLDAKGYPTSFKHQAEVIKSTWTYNGVKAKVSPRDEHERGQWTEIYGAGPWYRLTFKPSEKTYYDTYTYNISYLN